MVKRWNCVVGESSNGGVVELLNRRMVELSNGGNGGVVELSNGEMEE